MSKIPIPCNVSMVSAFFRLRSKKRRRHVSQSAPPPSETSSPALLMLREKVDKPLTPMLAIQGRSWPEDEAQSTVPPPGDSVYSPKGFRSTYPLFHAPSMVRARDYHVFQEVRD